MLSLPAGDPVAVASVDAIRRGDLETLRRLLREHPMLATTTVEEARPNGANRRTLLHIATDWPGHFPNVAATIAELVAHGAGVDARFAGSHTETPLHWAASTDDVEALDALLDAGADVEAPGSVIGGGTPLANAVAFGQWRAARGLVERGARSTLWQAAALGLLSRLQEAFARQPSPSPEEVTNAFWCACHGGQREAAEFLLARGASLNWIGHDQRTPLDAAQRSGATDVVEWLRSQGAKSTNEPG